MVKDEETFIKSWCTIEKKEKIITYQAYAKNLTKSRALENLKNND